MRVLMISGTYPPTFCGVGVYTERLVERLRDAKGVEIDLLSKESIKRWRIADLPAIWREVSRRRPDIVHVQYPTAAYRRNIGVNLLPWIIRAARPGVRLVVTLHEYHDTSVLGHIRNLITALPAHRVIVSNAEDLAELDVFIAKKKIELIPLGINIDKSFVDERVQNRLLDKYGLESGKYAVYFGNIDPSKGVAELVKSVARWGGSHKLVIIGKRKPEDAYHKMLDRLTRGSERIIWTDYLDDSEAASLMAAAELAVQPFSQPVSMRRSSVLTPMCLGVPVITTGPLKEPLTDKINCIGMADNSADSIAAAYNELSADARLREKIRSGGLELASRYDWNIVVRRHQEVYGGETGDQGLPDGR